MIPATQPNISAVSRACPHCGGHHSTTCPLIKAIEYHPSGAVKRVEFKTASDFPQAMSIKDWLGAPVATP